MTGQYLTTLENMATVFDGWVVSFDDAKRLEDWAIIYGHMNEPIVQYHLNHLRNHSENEDIADSTVGLYSIQVSYIFI